MHATTQRLPARPAAAKGFSLIELLVVIAIIVIIIAITVPALASARKAAKRSETANLLTDLAQGVAQFTLDEKRQPGYFTAQEMGSDQNLTEGMSTMQNVMLDMMGGVVPDTTPVAGTVIRVGPKTAQADKVLVDYAQIGRKQASGNKLYWNLPAKVFEKTDPTTGQPIDTGLPSRIGTHKAIREVVDAFGAPILGWAADESITKPVVTVDDFAQISTTGATGSPKARVYWAQNAAFLSSPLLSGATATYFGSRQLNQFGESMLNAPAGGAEKSTTLMGLLGNPGSPKNPTETNPAQMFPTGALAPLVFHSAGVDGYVLSIKDKGVAGCRTMGLVPVLDYGVNVKDKVLSKFDDLIQGAN